MKSSRTIANVAKQKIYKLSFCRSSYVFICVFCARVGQQNRPGMHEISCMVVRRTRLCGAPRALSVTLRWSTAYMICDDIPRPCTSYLTRYTMRQWQQAKCIGFAQLTEEKMMRITLHRKNLKIAWKKSPNSCPGYHNASTWMTLLKNSAFLTIFCTRSVIY